MTDEERQFWRIKATLMELMNLKDDDINDVDINHNLELITKIAYGCKKKGPVALRGKSADILQFRPYKNDDS